MAEASFGIKRAPELYQRVMDSMLEDVERSTVIMDDKKTEEEHDRVLKKVLDTATE